MQSSLVARRKSSEKIKNENGLIGSIQSHSIFPLQQRYVPGQ